MNREPEVVESEFEEAVLAFVDALEVAGVFDVNRQALIFCQWSFQLDDERGTGISPAIEVERGAQAASDFLYVESFVEIEDHCVRSIFGGDVVVLQFGGELFAGEVAGDLAVDVADWFLARLSLNTENAKKYPEQGQ